MKTLLIALFLLSPLASPGETIAIGKTTTGDWLYITNENGKCQGSTLVAHVDRANGLSAEGCWGLFDEKTLLIEWSDNKVGLYPMNGFAKPEDADHPPRKDI